MTTANINEELRMRLRQQELLAELGACALRGGEPSGLLQEATRLVALGLGINFAKVLRYLWDEDAFLVCAGVGWRDGVVGHARIGADLSSPAGYALRTGKPVISNSLAEESRFQTPALLVEHGILRAINVIIRSGDDHYGVLEADTRHEGNFEPQDIAFMQAAAALLGVALERRNGEMALAKAHAHSSEILESISDAFYAMDHDWRFTYFNSKAEALWGRDRVGMLGKVFWEEYPAAAGGVLHEAHLRAARERRVVTVEALSPVLHRWLDVTICPSDSGLSVYARDITRRKESEAALQRLTETLEQRVAARTRELADANERLSAEIAERRKAEAALMQAQRLEAIGQLTGGVAHDFNNLLTAVIGNLELLRPTQLTERAARHIEAALQAARRGGELTQQLLAYARKQHIEPRPVDVKAVVVRMVELLGRSLRSLVTVQADLADDLWHALCDPAQLEAILLNLAINARDAMPEGGRIWITTRNIEATHERLPPELEAGRYVLLAVTDEGSGMTPEVLSKAFEPFFTTKEVGKGRGLGLAQVQGVARQFGGTVCLRSTLGAGTTVEVFLPQANSDGTRTEAPVERLTNRPPPGDTTILVVDDQDDVRAVAVAFLQHAGYRVRDARDGGGGLALLQTTPVALALVDHGMAEMSGVEFVRQARRQRADLRVIYLTGYADPLEAESVDPHDPVLGKPYRPDDLLAVVKRLLDSI